jgi:hypothetical protein
LRILRYNIQFQFVKGQELFIADTLSRAYLQETIEKPMIMNINILDMVPDKRMEKVQEATNNDKTCVLLKETIINGWPENKEELPTEIQMYFNLRDILTTENGLILKGEQLLIPKSMRDLVKTKIHTSHLGYDSMMRRCRQSVYWPGMQHEIKQLAENCEVCAQHKPNNKKLTLQHQRSP